MSKAIDLNEKFCYQLVLFTWNGGADVLGYTDWTSDIIGDDGNTYSARPSMEVKLPKNSGDLSDDPCNIDMSLETGFLTDMTNGLPHATVSVRIAEISRPTNPAPQRTQDITFQGTIKLATRNVAGRKNNVRLICKSPKAETGVSMGQPCNLQCGNNLGDARCQVDMGVGGGTGNSYFGTINSITGRTLSVTIGLGLISADPLYFHRGTFTFAGLRIMIRHWHSGDPTTFVLVRQPPSSWLGQSVLVSSGCDKSVETCRSRYDNEEHFKGEGFGMPGYLPILESA